jgi:hypothetical protein
MKTLNYLFLSIFLICSTFAFGQNVLPDITVNNLNKKVVVSWLNEYKKPIQNIFIQRSYDSLKNFSTIGTVLNPLNLENGYPDLTPPYDRMFYRVTITFENGEYEIGKSARPIINPIELKDLDVTAMPIKVIKKEIVKEKIKEDTKVESNLEPAESYDTADMILLKPNEKINPIKKTDSIKGIIHLEKSIKTDLKKSIETAFPSLHIYTNKLNVVVINLQNTANKKYGLKFFDEKEKQVFEIKLVPDDYLFIEKSNFVHPGWFNFELYEDGVLIEKNKVFLAKDKVKNN